MKIQRQFAGTFYHNFIHPHFLHTSQSLISERGKQEKGEWGAGEGEGEEAETNHEGLLLPLL